MQNLNENLHLTPEQLALENSLSALIPTAPSINRDALLYAAGRASAPRPKLWPWQTATALALLTTLSLLFLNPTHSNTPQTAQSPLPTAPAPLTATTQLPMTNYQLPLPFTPSPSQFPYLTTRQNVLALGLSALPNSPNTGPTSPSLHPTDLNAFNTYQ